MLNQCVLYSILFIVRKIGSYQGIKIFPKKKRTDSELNENAASERNLNDEGTVLLSLSLFKRSNETKRNAKHITFNCNQLNGSFITVNTPCAQICKCKQQQKTKMNACDVGM